MLVVWLKIDLCVLRYGRRMEGYSVGQENGSGVLYLSSEAGGMDPVSPDLMVGQLIRNGYAMHVIFPGTSH